MPIINTDAIGQLIQGSPAAALRPIVRSDTPLATKYDQTNKEDIYKYGTLNPYAAQNTSGLSSIGPQQPFVFVRLTDSAVTRNLTKYDSQALPVGSTIRDLQRIGKFIITGNGILFNAAQLILQNANAFNETRIYNPASVLGAVAKTGTFGFTDRPIRFIRANGGVGNFFRTALLSAVGFQTRDFFTQHIEGTAGSQTNSPLPAYEGAGRAGLMRLQTAQSATTRFDRIWAGSAPTGTSIGQRLSTAFTNTLRSLIPSTNPLGIGQSGGNTWRYRPEYRDTQLGIYYDFLNNNDLIPYKSTPFATTRPEFYNGTKNVSLRTTSRGLLTREKFVPRKDFHKYYPQEVRQDPNSPTQVDDGLHWYASKGKTENELIEYTRKVRGLYEKYDRMLSLINLETTIGFNQNNVSTERFLSHIDAGVPRGKNYLSIPSNSTDGRYYTKFKTDRVTIEDKGFAKVSTRIDPNPIDSYNALSILTSKTQIISSVDANDSKDIIFFYFYDIINKKYIPFRAVLTQVYDQHTPTFSDVKYIGRADTLYIYKGFTRDVTLAVTVYANSVDELIPMWERINYMAGLSRPSRYTGRATATTPEEGENEQTVTTGLESGFIYPPMFEFRVGDMYVDQPAVFNSFSVSIPDKANWESLRSDNYYYRYGPDKFIKKDRRKSRQLPMMAELTMGMRLMEKKKSKTSNYHFGPTRGWKNVL